MTVKHQVHSVVIAYRASHYQVAWFFQAEDAPHRLLPAPHCL